MSYTVAIYEDGIEKYIHPSTAKEIVLLKDFRPRSLCSVGELWEVKRRLIELLDLYKEAMELDYNFHSSKAGETFASAIKTEWSKLGGDPALIKTLIKRIDNGDFER